MSAVRCSEAFRFFASRKSISNVSEEDIEAARKWLGKLDPDTIPKNICELSFSRSSGPGGQNVNKVNSKATLKVSADALLSHIPMPLHSEIRSSRYYAPRSDSIIIQADDSRKQNDNMHSCYAKLHHMIVAAGSKALPGETSAEQSQRVKNLQKAENEHRLRAKKFHSNKKSARKGGGNSD
ncbi:peptidyl-tRNA hydrolase domain-containing protein [Lepidopterella palustris CBS 459.81]|uniref:Peptidyl-tRNA hydrolase domain-containing protein n=1 Tax=Lepidopterella palustris CBS 459.81 TaxID=1314670 RepID=A0A8E2JJA8_9PEZI|nr:peptidyl-tRNA hydrolase domain-containing protein [Lepidopterella palustris CBS 459.81]